MGTVYTMEGPRDWPSGLEMYIHIPAVDFPGSTVFGKLSNFPELRCLIFLGINTWTSRGHCEEEMRSRSKDGPAHRGQEGQMQGESGDWRQAPFTQPEA